MLFSIVSIVFLAGCARGPSVPSGAGVVITSFTPETNLVAGEQDVVFILAVQNTGERTATQMKVALSGLSNEWVKVGGEVDLGAVKSITGSLAGSDASTGFKGDSTSIDWTYKSAKSKTTADITYDASARFFYKYDTVHDAIVRFVTSAHLRTAPNTPKGIQSATTTQGPLFITTTARTPIIASGDTTGRIQFEIQNIGPGRVYDCAGTCEPSVILDQIDKITITGVGAAGQCTGVGTPGDTQTLTDQKLVAGKSKSVSCTIDAKTITNFKDFAVTVTVEYKYFVDSATSVTVSKAI